MPRYRFFLAISWLVVFSGAAVSQEDGIEAAIEQSQSSAATRELKAQANAETPKTDDTHEIAIFYHKRGVANRRLGNFARAVEDLRLALENVEPNRPTPNGWGDRRGIQGELALSYGNGGNRIAAIDEYNRLAEESKGIAPYSYRFAQSQLIFNYAQLGLWPQAEAARQAATVALQALRATNEWSTQGISALASDSFTNAQFFRDRGEIQEAERRFRVALEYAQENAALQRRTKPAGHVSTIAAQGMDITLRAALAKVLADQGKYGEAESFASSALHDALNWGGFNSQHVTNALWGLAWSRFQQADRAGSEKYFRHALASVEGSASPPHSTHIAVARANLASVLLVPGGWDEALRLFEERDRGLRSDAAQFNRTGSNHVGWAYALHKTEQSQRAALMAGRMADDNSKRAVPDRWYVAQLRGVLGMSLAATGKTAEALTAYRESIPDLIRRDQDNATAENSGYWRAFWQRVILESYLELLATIQLSGEAISDLDLIDESFWIADVARGSSVQGAIAATAARAQLPDRQLAELARKEQDALNRIVALNRILARLASASEQDRLNKIMSDMRVEIERLRMEHATLRADIRKRYPEYADLIDPKPAGISDVRKALAPGEALVSIYLGESQAYVWTIAAGGMATFRVVPLKREELEADVRQLRRAVDLGAGDVAQIRPFDLARAYKLYRAFFEPDEALWKDARVLNVIPHGALGELPFALLVTAQSQQPPAGAQAAYADVPWLARKVAIAQLPSASAFAALRRAPPAKVQRQPFIGFGDPLFTADSGTRSGAVRNLTVRKIEDNTEVWLKTAMRGGNREAGAAPPAMPTLAQSFALLSALPDTSYELREIAAVLKADAARDVFVNRQATEKNVKASALDNRRVVAFATHGIAPGELTGLDQPALALSNPALTGDSDNDGFLTMEEVLGLKLDADWVVLSACNTGSADGRGSEAVSGLGRAFFYAGARSLLVSNWAVETTSARLLTTEVFKRQSDNPQLTRAEALRQSMLSLMTKSATDASGRATFSYAHPAFWAPFSLVGDGAR